MRVGELASIGMHPAMPRRRRRAVLKIVGPLLETMDCIERRDGKPPT